MTISPTFACSMGSQIEAQLRDQETILHCVETDLDSRLRFRAGVLAVTNQRLMAHSPDVAQWQSWEFQAGLQMRHHDHAGVGHLELLNESGLLAHWRFPLGQNLQVIRLSDGFHERLEEEVADRRQKVEQNTCPSCKANLEPDQEECPGLYQGGSYTTIDVDLLRLWRFARPYRFCRWRSA